jgi:hypothetical protein
MNDPSGRGWSVGQDCVQHRFELGRPHIVAGSLLGRSLLQDHLVAGAGRSDPQVGRESVEQEAMSSDLGEPEGSPVMRVAALHYGLGFRAVATPIRAYTHTDARSDWISRRPASCPLPPVIEAAHLLGADPGSP